MNCYDLYMRTVLLIYMFKVHEAHPGLRIIGGRNASEDEYNYVVKLEVVPVNITELRPATKTFCSASVLTSTRTLTAAHCIQFLEKYANKNPNIEHKNMLRIRQAGEQTPSGGDPSDDVGKPAPNEDLFEILSYHKHPAYKGIIIASIILIENDIGMLHTEPISLAHYAKVSAVDFTTVIGQTAIAVGYGVSVILKKMKQNISHPLPRPLKVLEVAVVKCPKLWHLYPAVCVAQRCGRSTTMCAGDSGGPLVHSSGIIAITSVNEARDCMVEGKERSRTVGVLTAISPYISWITSHVMSGQ